MSELPTNRIKKIRQFKIRLANIIGMEMPSGEKVSFRHKTVVSCLLFTQVMQINGIVDKWGSVVDICCSMVLYTIAFQLIARLIRNLMRDDTKIVNNLYALIVKFYEREQVVVKNQSALMKNLKKSEFFLKVYIIITTICFHIPALTAWIAPFYTHEYKLFMPLYLPLTDPTKFYGFVINMLIMTFASSLVNAVFIAGDAYIIFTSFQVTPMSDILRFKFREFGEKLSQRKKNQIKTLKSKNFLCDDLKIKNEMRKTQNEQRKEQEKFESQLIDLIKEFHDLNDYIQHLIDYAEFTFFIVILCNAMAIGFILIVIKFFSIPIGISILIILFEQVATSCLIGTMISNENEKLIEEIWSFPWYELSLKNQKIFLQFIHVCQNANMFDLLMIGPLNMERFTEIMNGSYSYLMYLLNFM